MTLKLPPSYVQIPLIDVMPDKKLETPGESRTRYGKAVEEIVIELLKLTDIPNSGTHDTVFDAFGHDHFVEIKSLRATSSIPIYEWRRVKDRECGVPLVYVIGLHRCGKCSTISEIYQSMSSTLRTLLVLPASSIDALAEQFPVRQLVKEEKGTRMGYKRKGYCEGYRLIPAKVLLGLPYVAPLQVSSALYGLNLDAEVKFHESLTPWKL